MSATDSDDRLRRMASLVGVGTAASGVALVAAPGLSLRMLGAATAEPAPFLFRVIGMFMGVTGGLLADAARAENPPPIALRWALVGKVGAAVLVTTAVRSERFGRQAVALAAVDAGSAGLLATMIARRR